MPKGRAPMSVVIGHNRPSFPARAGPALIRASRIAQARVDAARARPLSQPLAEIR
jgi:hypothetical protein